MNSSSREPSESTSSLHPRDRARRTFWRTFGMKSFQSSSADGSRLRTMLGLLTGASPSNGRSWSAYTESRANEVTTFRSYAQRSKRDQKARASSAVADQAKGPPYP